MANQAAWLTVPKTDPFTISSALTPTPVPYEVIIHNHAIAINPLEWARQSFSILTITYPQIIGSDAAGIVTAVGSDVTSFRLSDRVIAQPHGIDMQNPANGGFQFFCAANVKLVAKLPVGIGFAQGCVLPLGLLTAAAALFQKDGLGLPLPGVCKEPLGKVVLVWGGGSSVGSCAMQMAKAAGLEIAVTASARNGEYCKGLGADYVFDYMKDSVVEDVVGVLKGKQFAGAFVAVVEPDSIRKCAEIERGLEGSGFVATVLPPGMPVPEGLPGDVRVSHTSMTEFRRGAGVEVRDAIWTTWVPAALADGSLKYKPDPLVVGNGLDKVQDGLDKQKNRVSAQKIMVKL